MQLQFFYFQKYVSSLDPQQVSLFEVSEGCSTGEQMAEKSTLGLAPCSFNYDTKKLHQFFNFTREMSDVFVTILVMLVVVLCEPTQWLPSEFNCGAFSAILGTLQTNTDVQFCFL